MKESVLIIDFGSQYTELIAKKIRKCQVYSHVIPYTQNPMNLDNVKGIILSGGACSVSDEKPFNLDVFGDIPILGICYGAQIIAQHAGETISISETREFGEHKIILEKELLGIQASEFSVWMSHNDSIVSSQNIEVLAKSEKGIITAFKIPYKLIFGLQFHPEVSHTVFGEEMLSNFVKLCSISSKFTLKNFREEKIKNIRETVQDKKVLMAVSGGIDSTVTACLLKEAIGENLHCVFINNGLLRKNEVFNVKNIFRKLELQVKVLECSDDFYKNLKNIVDPEQKRKVIGRVFIEKFQEYANILGKYSEKIQWLGQGTIYPDVIESISGKGPIKSHHNVGGLPENMELKIIEPIRELFKNEVRELGLELGIPPEIINRHPFPGPGLSIRIIGDVTQEKIKILQEADHIFISELEQNNLYNEIWQAGAILISIKTVGVMGDKRTYEYPIVLRAVCSENGMTANPYSFCYDFLSRVGTKIIDEVEGVNRVTYDISSKPPATIEWE